MPVSGHKILAYGEENCFKHPSPSARHIFLHPGSHYWVFRILLQRGGWSASHPENLRAPPNLDGALVLLASVDQLVRQVSLLIEIKLQAARTWNNFFLQVVRLLDQICWEPPGDDEDHLVPVVQPPLCSDLRHHVWARAHCSLLPQAGQPGQQRGGCRVRGGRREVKTSTQSYTWVIFGIELSRWVCIGLPDSGAMFAKFVIAYALLGTSIELLRFQDLAL